MKTAPLKQFSLLCVAALASAQLFAQSVAPLPMTDGEVRRIDTANGKITLKHGDIKNLDMPGMTMVFRVSDPAMLWKIAVGDKIKFTVEQKQEGFTVMALEKTVP